MTANSLFNHNELLQHSKWYRKGYIAKMESNVAEIHAMKTDFIKKPVLYKAMYIMGVNVANKKPILEGLSLIEADTAIQFMNDMRNVRDLADRLDS